MMHSELSQVWRVYVGQWCEAMHVHMGLTHVFLLYTKPHQTQLHLKVKHPEQVLPRRAFSLVFLSLKALSACVCMCVYCTLEKSLFRKTILGMNAPEMQLSVIMEAEDSETNISHLSLHSVTSYCTADSVCHIVPSTFKKVSSGNSEFAPTCAWQPVFGDNGVQGSVVIKYIRIHAYVTVNTNSLVQMQKKN